MLAIRLPEGVLRVRARAQIARTRADSDRFSEMSEDRETGWWSGVDLNPRPRLRHFIAKLSASLAGYSEKKKAAMLERYSSPDLRYVSSLPEVLRRLRR